MDLVDGAAIEAASWQLACELVRRHPKLIRLIRGHPGGGQYDLLWLLQLPQGGGDIQLNRHGSIQVHARFDGREAIDWIPTEWEQYLASDPKDFLLRLESAAGLPSPGRASPATPTTLTYRILAEIASTARGGWSHVDIQEGYIDTSGAGGGPNSVLEEFSIDPELLRVRDDDFFGEPGYRFWIVVRDGWPILALEQTRGVAWIYGGGSRPTHVMELYRGCQHNVGATTWALLAEVDGLL